MAASCSIQSFLFLLFHGSLWCGDMLKFILDLVTCDDLTNEK